MYAKFLCQNELVFMHLISFSYFLSLLFFVFFFLYLFSVTSFVYSLVSCLFFSQPIHIYLFHKFLQLLFTFLSVSYTSSITAYIFICLCVSVCFLPFFNHCVLFCVCFMHFSIVLYILSYKLIKFCLSIYLFRN